MRVIICASTWMFQDYVIQRKLHNNVSLSGYEVHCNVS